MSFLSRLFPPRQPPVDIAAEFAALRLELESSRRAETINYSSLAHRIDALKLGADQHERVLQLFERFDAKAADHLLAEHEAAVGRMNRMAREAIAHGEEYRAQLRMMEVKYSHILTELDKAMVELGDKDGTLQLHIQSAIDMTRDEEKRLRVLAVRSERAACLLAVRRAIASDKNPIVALEEMPVPA